MPGPEGIRPTPPVVEGQPVGKRLPKTPVRKINERPDPDQEPPVEPPKSEDEGKGGLVDESA